jgi:hypothetical protein
MLLNFAVLKVDGNDFGAQRSFEAQQAIYSADDVFDHIDEFD